MLDVLAWNTRRPHLRRPLVAGRPVFMMSVSVIKHISRGWHPWKRPFLALAFCADPVSIPTTILPKQWNRPEKLQHFKHYHHGCFISSKLYHCTFHWLTAHTNPFSTSRIASKDSSGNFTKHSAADNLQDRTKLSPSDAMVNVGKFVPHKVLNLIDYDTGEMLEAIPSSEAVVLAQKKDLKLVLVNQHAKPLPLYKLMTGKELHDEQMKMEETRKSRAKPTTVKEIRLSAGIGLNDLMVKRKHIVDWLKKETNTNIRISVAQKRHQNATKEEMEALIHKLIDDMEVPLIFNNEPKMFGADQQNMSVLVRPMSAKEKAKMNKENNLMEKARSVTATED